MIFLISSASFLKGFLDGFHTFSYFFNLFSSFPRHSSEENQAWDTGNSCRLARSTPQTRTIQSWKGFFLIIQECSQKRTRPGTQETLADWRGPRRKHTHFIFLLCSASFFKGFFATPASKTPADNRRHPSRTKKQTFSRPGAGILP